MGRIINVEKEEFTGFGGKEAAFARATRENRELANMIEENGLDRYADTSIYKKDMNKMTHQERKQHMLDMEFEQMCITNHWEGEEKQKQKAIFVKEKAEEKRISDEIFRLEWDLIFYNGENLTEFERKQAEKYLADNPDDEAILRGMVNMVAMGINDPEHVTDYADPDS
jgi:hypothetical protein